MKCSQIIHKIWSVHKKSFASMSKGVAAKQLKGVVWLAAPSQLLAFVEEDLKYGELEKQAKSVYCVARGKQEYQI